MRFRVIYFAYRSVSAVLLPAGLLYFAVRGLKNRAYWSTIWQRLGFLPAEYQQTGGGAVWFHAVSVGEALALRPLLAQVRAELPGAACFVSTSTLAGFAAARERLRGQVEGVFYAPADTVGCVRRVLRRIQPSLVVVMETEIWPNLFRESRRAGARLLVVNGRISDRAAGRYRKGRWFFRAVLRQADAILAQSEAMRARFIEAGAPAEIVEVGGNLKYDAVPDAVGSDSPVARFFDASLVATATGAGSKVWVAASTCSDGVRDEEDAVIRAFKALVGWKLLLAPRQPARCGAVAEKLRRAGVPFVRRSELREGSSADVLLLDTVGELAGLFALADAVFIGGTLVKLGGHNVLEPAWFGKTITVGPNLENFREIAAEFREARAFREIHTEAELTPFVDAGMAERARACALRNRGAAARAGAKMRAMYGEAFCVPGHALWRRLLLGPLAQVWRWGSARRRAGDLRRQRKLGAPVISVGNITVGGTGKTPVVLHLAERFAEAGPKPGFAAGILTRGFGRASPHESLLVERGGRAAVPHTGDEAQLMLRRGLAALGVGADRGAIGQAMLDRKLANVLLLDDGFQHLRLARDFDLVLIDALAPFGGHALVPLGRLREPLEQLARASAFLITRVDPGRNTGAIEAELRRWNPRAPVFRCRTVAQEWHEFEGPERRAAGKLPSGKSLAFCGLGNPRSFWNTLRELSIEPLETLEFGDHHRYSPREVVRFGRLGRSLGADLLLTTEKDAMNLCEVTREAIEPLRLFWLQVGLAIEGEEELWRMIRERIGR